MSLAHILPIPQFLHPLDDITLRHNPSFLQQLYNGGQLQGVGQGWFFDGDSYLIFAHR